MLFWSGFGGGGGVGWIEGIGRTEVGSGIGRTEVGSLMSMEMS